jgi:hypothetical protein
MWARFLTPITANLRRRRRGPSHASESWCGYKNGTGKLCYPLDKKLNLQERDDEKIHE